MGNTLRFISVLYFSFIFSCTAQNENPQKDFQQEVEIPLGGNTFQTSGNELETIGESGIESWSTDDSEFTVYVKSSIEKEVLLSLDIDDQEKNSTIEVIAETRFPLKLHKGQSGKLEVGKISLSAGYSKISLKGIDKEGTDFAKIKNLIISYSGDLELNYVKDNVDHRFYWGRRGPSVHLSYTLPSSQNFKWFYNEITVPDGQDPIGSYFMANGFGEGYFGIQVNSETERRILFSVWSPYETDDPTNIPDDQKIILLKKGENVYSGEFGNEGSGGQSFLNYPWKAGKTYSFLNSVEPDGKGNTIYTAYFKDPEVDEWMLIASFLRPNTDTWYQRPHSFLENFIPESGHIQRSAFYQNQWARSEDGEWVELTSAKFTGDDIAKRGYRKDYAGGETNGEFYLKNGGFFDQETELNSMHQRTPTGKEPQIDWQKLQ